MRLSEIRELIQLRQPHLDRVSRVLARCVTIDDLRGEARRRWPRGVRDYVDGGADGEVSLARNRAAFEAYDLVPSALRGVATTDLRTSLLGADSALPFAMGPTGYTRLMHTEGERAAVRTAGAAGIPYTLSTMATVSVEDVAAAAPDAQRWFQLYIWRDRTLIRDLLQRAQGCGYRVLVITTDTPVTGLRARDHRNGFTLPPRLTPKTLVDMARHPAWCLAMLRGEPVTFANFAPEFSARSENIMSFAAHQFDPSVNWDDLDEIRELWPGPIMLKGILDPQDVIRARERGIDAVALSNHGGRQLDQARAPIAALPDVRAAVGDTMSIMVDSGVRHGTDIAVALALGADGVLIGRPYLYGLGAAGEAGCAAAVRMLTDELRRAMQLLGVASVAELRERGASLVQATRAS